MCHLVRTHISSREAGLIKGFEGFICGVFNSFLAICLCILFIEMLSKSEYPAFPSSFLDSLIICSNEVFDMSSHVSMLGFLCRKVLPPFSLMHVLI